MPRCRNLGCLGLDAIGITFPRLSVRVPGQEPSQRVVGASNGTSLRAPLDFVTFLTSVS